jgi:hypothetical protein
MKRRDLIAGGSLAMALTACGGGGGGSSTGSGALPNPSPPPSDLAWSSSEQLDIGDAPSMFVGAVDAGRLPNGCRYAAWQERNLGAVSRFVAAVDDGSAGLRTTVLVSGRSIERSRIFHVGNRLLALWHEPDVADMRLFEFNNGSWTETSIRRSGTGGGATIIGGPSGPASLVYADTSGLWIIDSPSPGSWPAAQQLAPAGARMAEHGTVADADGAALIVGSMGPPSTSFVLNRRSANAAWDPVTPSSPAIGEQDIARLVVTGPNRFLIVLKTDIASAVVIDQGRVVASGRHAARSGVLYGNLFVSNGCSGGVLATIGEGGVGLTRAIVLACDSTTAQWRQVWGLSAGQALVDGNVGLTAVTPAGASLLLIRTDVSLLAVRGAGLDGPYLGQVPVTQVSGPSDALGAYSVAVAGNTLIAVWAERRGAMWRLALRTLG